MTTLREKLRDPRDGIQSSRRGEHIPTPPASDSAGREGKRKKKKKNKKKRNTTKEKSKPVCEQKKRGHPSTPSHSDDSEKPQTQQSTNTEKNSDLNHAKEKSARNCRKGKSTQTAVEETPGSDNEDKMEAGSQTQDSLRWEGVLDDPIAEAERLEVYKANRRTRYKAFRQALLENAKTVLSSETDVNKLGRTCKAGSATFM